MEDKIYQEHTFDECIDSWVPIHSPKVVSDMIAGITSNMVVYGPPGVGKYTLVLHALQTLSPSKLKYSKKLYVEFDKSQYVIAMSDIHYEIDMELLMYNSNSLWHELYQHIVDLVPISTSATCPKIIVCKKFHEINNELLDNFHIYMQDPSIRFVLITNSLGFIPDNIRLSTKTVNVPRPTKTKYSQVFASNNTPYTKPLRTPVMNIKSPKTPEHHVFLCNNIVSMITDISKFSYIAIRNAVYELLVFNMDIPECLWYVLWKLCVESKILPEQLPNVLTETCRVMTLYNNNYHNIYHLEYYVCYLIMVVHQLTQVPSDVL